MEILRSLRAGHGAILRRALAAAAAASASAAAEAAAEAAAAEAAAAEAAAACLPGAIRRPQGGGVRADQIPCRRRKVSSTLAIQRSPALVLPTNRRRGGMESQAGNFRVARSHHRLRPASCVRARDVPRLRRSIQQSRSTQVRLDHGSESTGETDETGGDAQIQVRAQPSGE